ncbi:thioesterase [Nonomuraea sp. K274]|uniref:Thioesterase n=1 Tax=Nonomuraea cypriaca TaxID=1187855 RepID=A0A931AF68_9ACTN|nr:alpha/beta fold hydrolase [Nonomuraea cypriaca]MBF8191746.1 thioesterase [Nonomuraea cypriaca]
MTGTTLDDAWIRRYHSGPGDRPTLVCFPHAGGAASYFFPLSGALKSSLQVVALQYPGRQDRRHQPCPSTIAEFAEGAYAALKPLMSGPVAFFGHSMGAVIAFEVADRMRERLGAAPSALFASGRRAPSTTRDENVRLRGDDGLIAELRRLSGTGDEILEDEELLRLILPPLRSDYAAIETYRYRPGPKLGCPVLALIGDEDPRCDLDEARAWADHTTGPFSLHTFSGGHFYLTDHLGSVADLVSRQLGTP